jgi:hypothetical protein
MVDGGWIDGLVISGIQIQDARAPLFIRRGDRANRFATNKAGLRGVLIDGVHATGAILTSSVTGIPGMYIEDVRLANFHVDTVMPGDKSWLKSSVPEVPAGYPESRMFGWLPASGLYCRHVRGLSLRDVTFTSPAQEWRNTVIFDDVHQLKLDGFTSTSAIGGVPPLLLTNTRDVWISGSAAPMNSSAFARIEGSESGNLLISGCDIRGAATLADISAEVNTGVVRGEFNITK